MKWLTLEQIKRNSRIDGNDEDELLIEKGEQAEDQVLGDIGRTYQELIEWKGGVPSDLVAASLMLVDAAYQQRCAISNIQWYVIAFGYESKIKKYVRLADRSSYDETTGGYVIGSQLKILVAAELPDELKMEDVPFTVVVYNGDVQNKQHTYDKSECLLTTDGDYVVMVDSEELGVGQYMVKLTVQIPDTDYPSGYRKEIIRINPNVRVTG